MASLGSRLTSIIARMDAETEGEFFNLDDAALDDESFVAQYNERFKPGIYRQVFYPPASGQWKIDALFPEGFFESAKLLLSGVAGPPMKSPGIRTLLEPRLPSGNLQSVGSR